MTPARKLAAISGACLFVSAPQIVAAQDVSVDGAFGDNMVLQREAPVILSGTARPSAEIAVELNSSSAKAMADDDGNWSLELPPLTSGGPYKATIFEDGETAISAGNIFVGDVYLCSGQSNMEFPVSRSLPGGTPPLGDPATPIRLLTVPKEAVTAPLRDLPEDTRWQDASPETIADFSAVCWLTATKLQSETPAPIGLIDASWGGSQIEAWLPDAKLRAVEGYDEPISLLDLYLEDTSSAMAAYGKGWEAWWTETHDGAAPWRDSADTSGWKPVPDGEMQDWKTYGDPETAHHLGMVWFRTTFEVDEDEASKPARLSLGMFDDIDATWVNGQFIGTTFSWDEPRTYDVPAGILKAGENTITVNVSNSYGQGGMLGPRAQMQLAIKDGSTVPVGEDWSYSVVTGASKGAPDIPWTSVSGLTTIHNGMIAPLGHPALAGAIWYQGESNTDTPASYQRLLGALTADWRERFSEDLPIVIVQLPNFGGMPGEPGPSGWAEIREAQRLAARHEELTGLAVTIDAGDRTDIHPPNKPLVASRVAAAMRELQAGNTAIADGLTPVNARRQRGHVVVEMPSSELTAISSATPIAFELCTEDGTCEWARAELEGSKISLRADNAREAASVRYCWGDAPICNLFGPGDVPVAPFEISIAR